MNNDNFPTLSEISAGSEEHFLGLLDKLEKEYPTDIKGLSYTYRKSAILEGFMQRQLLLNRTYRQTVQLCQFVECDVNGNPFEKPDPATLGAIWCIPEGRWLWRSNAAKAAHQKAGEEFQAAENGVLFADFRIVDGVVESGKNWISVANSYDDEICFCEDGGILVNNEWWADNINELLHSLNNDLTATQSAQTLLSIPTNETVKA